MKELRTANVLTSWDDLENKLNISVPHKHRSLFFSGLSLGDFLREWVADNDDEKYRRVLSNERILKSEMDALERPYYGTVQLFPEQQWVVEPTIKALGLDSDTASCVYNISKTGAGKTYEACAVIAELFKRGVFAQPRYMFMTTKVMLITPKPVMIQYERVLRAFGLGDFIDDGTIVIENYAALYTKRSETLLQIKYDPVLDESRVVWYPTSRPGLLILDEGHKVANLNTKQTTAVRALIRDSPGTALMLFSATPFIKVNDAYILATSIRRPFWNGQVVDDTNFRLFAASLSPEPAKPNLEAVRRLKAAIGPYIIDTPYVKWPSRQVNSVLCCDFENDTDRDIYHAAAARLREKTIMLGKNHDHRFKLMVELNAFCNTAEPLRAHFYAQKCITNFRTGDRATIIATRNKETIVKTLHTCIKAGIRRDQVSIIWGGVDNYDPADLYTLDEARKLLLSAGDDVLDDRTYRRVVKSLRYYEDQIRHGETAEEQAARHALLRQWGLFGVQTAERRQEEVDRFQTGRTIICLMTAAAGGTGLSLDKYIKALLDRELYGSPSFNAREVAQMNGRTVRRATIQKHVHQYMCFLRGTVEEQVIMPYMDSKLACMAGFNKSNIDLAKVWLDAVSGESVEVPQRVRDLQQALADAESDESQMIDTEVDDEED